VKKPLPKWSIAAVLVVVLGGVGVGLLKYSGPSIDKDLLIRTRARPGGSTAPSAESYGRPKGTPIIPGGSTTTNDPRRKPTG